MAWSIKILDVKTPSLARIVTYFTLFKDGKQYVNDEIQISAGELEAAGATDNDKKNFVKAKIDEKALQYVSVNTSASKLSSFIGTEYNL